MTSNPTIFEKAIGAGTDYDEQLQAAPGSAIEKNADALFWDLAIQDIQSACDAVRVALCLVGRKRRLRQPRGLAAAGARHRRHDRDGRSSSGSGRSPKRHDQDSGHQGRAPRRSKSRSTAGYNINVTLIFSVEMYERGRAWPTSRVSGAASTRASRSTRSVRSTPSSSAGSTRRSTSCSQERIAKGEKLEHLLGKAGIAGPQAHLPEVQGDLLRRRVCSAQGKGRRGPAAALGLDVDQESTLSGPHVRRERSSAETPSTRCRPRRSTHCSITERSNPTRSKAICEASPR